MLKEALGSRGCRTVSRIVETHVAYDFRINYSPHYQPKLVCEKTDIGGCQRQRDAR
ncbi:hypothetical protein CBM2634_B170073 [Cupriavidus taiwanensis]|uniref:Uncharacterized protein n=1 Tax=Cupriavidus taiwanensis TaxID=164546 RepID=A0A375JAX3_9BURK|nr:hypothetical protein CBM2634_B170073 [Cupriavidus taiwanensis]